MSDFASIYGDYGDQAAAAIRRRANQSTAYGQSVFYGQQRGARALADLAQKFKEGFRPQVSSLQQRGLRSSGITRNALANYASEYQRNIDAQRATTAEELQGLATQDQAAQDTLDEYLNQLKFQKNKDVLATAADLSSIGQFGG